MLRTTRAQSVSALACWSVAAGVAVAEAVSVLVLVLLSHTPSNQGSSMPSATPARPQKARHAQA